MGKGKDIVSSDASTKPDEQHKNHDAYFVPGLRRGLLLLETLADANQPLNVSELAKRMGLSRSSVFRLTYTLRYMGFLEELPSTKSFTLGPRILNIGYAFLATKDIIDVSRPDLEQLRDATNISAHLSIRDRTEVLYLSCVQSRSGFHSNFNVGTRLPVHAAPMGWLLLATLTEEGIGKLLRDDPLEALTDLTPRTLPDLLRRVSEISKQGYAMSRGAVEDGGSTIAAPVRNHDDEIVAAIDVSGPDSAFRMEEWDTLYVKEVVAAAERISVRLGHMPHRRRGG